MSKFAITNAQVILPDKIIPRGTIVVEDKKIAAIYKKRLTHRGSIIRIDARGNFVGPGFIDLHIHGDEVEWISHQQTRGGTTGFLATLHPSRPEALLRDIVRVLTQKEKVSGAKVLGLRLEGPFLNRTSSGALPKKTLRNPDVEETKEIIRQAGRALKIIVLAPELKRAYSLIRYLRERDIIASIGHTRATYEQAKRGIEAGITYATHTFNRMGLFDHRQPGALGAVLTDSRVSCEVIVDGVHVHPAALKILLACKGLDKVILVTDSTSAKSHPDKRPCGIVFRLKSGVLYGTALTLNKALKNAIEFFGIGLVKAVRLVTLNPARILKIDNRKGSLAAGKDADIVIFDKDFNIKMTMVEGKIVYSRR